MERGTKSFPRPSALFMFRKQTKLDRRRTNIGAFSTLSTWRETGDPLARRQKFSRPLGKTRDYFTRMSASCPIYVGYRVLEFSPGSKEYYERRRCLERCVLLCRFSDHLKGANHRLVPIMADSGNYQPPPSAKVQSLTFWHPREKKINRHSPCQPSRSHDRWINGLFRSRTGPLIGVFKNAVRRTPPCARVEKKRRELRSESLNSNNTMSVNRSEIDPNAVSPAPFLTFLNFLGCFVFLSLVSTLSSVN